MTTKKKQYRSPRPKPGQIKVAWGRARDCDPQLVAAWAAGGGATAGYIMTSLTEKYAPKSGRSLVDELEARGYDITTLKFSIEKKKANPIESTGKP